jgi:hypothetical protein
MEANLEVVNGAGYQVSLSMEMEPQEALAMEVSQELMATDFKVQKALETLCGMEFRAVVLMETDFLEVPVKEAAYQIKVRN